MTAPWAPHKKAVRRIAPIAKDKEGRFAGGFGPCEQVLKFDILNGGGTHRHALVVSGAGHFLQFTGRYPLDNRPGLTRKRSVIPGCPRVKGISQVEGIRPGAAAQQLRYRVFAPKQFAAAVILVDH